LSHIDSDAEQVMLNKFEFVCVGSTCSCDWVLLWLDVVFSFISLFIL